MHTNTDVKIPEAETRVGGGGRLEIVGIILKWI